jgi:hypothetical protein
MGDAHQNAKTLRRVAGRLATLIDDSIDLGLRDSDSTRPEAHDSDPPLVDPVAKSFGCHVQFRGRFGYAVKLCGLRAHA